MRIGIYGGTFDPIHFAHLHVIAYALENAQLDVCHVVVARDPWQKPNVGADSRTRLRWVEKSVQDFFPKVKNVVVDDREIMREGKSYTVDTLRSFRDQYPGAELFLIVGDDIPERISTWEKHEDILEMAELFVVPRAIVPISSTYIREQAAGNRTIKGLVPYSVEIDIIDNSLYTNQP